MAFRPLGLLTWIAAGTLVSFASVPAVAKTDAPKPAGTLRCAHSYAEALAEAKDRGCIVFATFHEDG